MAAPMVLVSLDFVHNYAIRYEVDETRPRGKRAVKKEEFRIPNPDALDVCTVDHLRYCPGDFA